MNTRREFLIGFGYGLLLAAGGAALAAGDQKAASPSPSDVVRDFLAARARHDAAAQYALLSDEARAEVPFPQFDTQFAVEKTPLAHAAEDGVSPLLAAVTVFFMDAHGLYGYQFAVVGPDPGDAGAVLVHARPPGVTPEKAFLLKIVTAPDWVSRLPRLEIWPSYQKTNPHDVESMRPPSGLISLSNLRQIGLGFIIYAQAHDGHLPDADGWVDSLLAMPEWKIGDPNFRPEGLFRDPAAPEAQPWNYAFNRALSGVRLGDIKDPASTVLVFESAAGVKNAADTGQSLPRPGRHFGGDYYVFADGRAKWFPDGAKLRYGLEAK